MLDLYQDDCQFCASLAQFVVWIGHSALPWQRRAFRSTFDKWFATAARRTVRAFCHAKYTLMIIDVCWFDVHGPFWSPVQHPFCWLLVVYLPLQMGTADADLAYLKKEVLRCCCSLGLLCLLHLEAPSSACAVEHVFFQLQQTHDEPLSTPPPHAIRWVVNQMGPRGVRHSSFQSWMKCHLHRMCMLILAKSSTEWWQGPYSTGRLWCLQCYTVWNILAIPFKDLT